MMFILGLITGLLISCFIAILVTRFRNPIERTITQTQSKAETLMGKEMSYIAGMSEEESNFAATLPLEKEVKIL